MSIIHFFNELLELFVKNSKLHFAALKVAISIMSKFRKAVAIVLHRVELLYFQDDIVTSAQDDAEELKFFDVGWGEPIRVFLVDQRDHAAGDGREGVRRGVKAVTRTVDRH